MQAYTAGFDLSDYHTLLSGDLSGIQDFIFNIQSEGAAKTLKARSFYVQALSDLCIAMIEAKLGTDKCLLYYNGGGNFYIFCKSLSEEQLSDLNRAVQQSLADLEIYLCLSQVPLHATRFKDTWREVHRQSNLVKLQKFGEYPAALSTAGRYQTDKWKKFVKKLTTSQGFSIRRETGQEARISKRHLFEFGFRLSLDNQAQQFEGSILNKLPEWTKELMHTHDAHVKKINARAKEKDPDAKNIKAGDIIDFESFGHFAKTRTGTDKIAVLKMDVDDLGALFLEVNDIARTKRISDALKNFFDQQMYRMWADAEGFDYLPTDSKKQKAKALFRENVYVVFAGGDDCMMIGAWDAVFEFAGRIRQAFINDETLKAIGLEKPLTLSASLTVLDSKFPVVRMSAVADEALTVAKYAVPEEKNRISIFDRVLTWEEFGRAVTLAKELEEHIKNEQVNRSILDRVQRSHLGFERLMEKAIHTGNIYNPAVWRLFYFIRGSKKADYLQGIMTTYQNMLLNAAIKKKRTNGSALFPVAARWAEFLTRKTS